jgi:hypothetical protein
VINTLTRREAKFHTANFKPDGTLAVVRIAIAEAAFKAVENYGFHKRCQPDVAQAFINRIRVH